MRTWQKRITGPAVLAAQAELTEVERALPQDPALLKSA
jgi:hypothetical protein